MTNHPTTEADELREQTRCSIARQISNQRGGDDWNGDDYITAGNILFICNKLITSQIQATCEEVIDRLEENTIEAQYYIPNSPDDTYVSGEVIRLSSLRNERQRLAELSHKSKEME